MFDDQRGDIIARWLVQLAAVMLVVALVGYEAISIAVTHLNLDEDARQVAAATRSTYRGARDIDEATAAGIEAADEQGIDVISVTETGNGDLTFELERTASTLLIHRIDPLEGLTVVRTSRTVPLTP